MQWPCGVTLVLAALPALAQEKGIDSWISQLESGSVTERRVAVYELWKLKDKAKRATVALAYALRDEDDYVRETAARALENLSLAVADAVPPLEQALHDERVAVRRAGARFLARVGPDAFEALGSLRTALRDEDPEVRRDAVSTFSHFGLKGAASAAEIEGLLKEDPDGQVRMWAANALFVMGTPPSCAPTLLAALKDTAPGVQERAVGALQVLAPEVTIPVDTLLAMLASESRMSRGAAAMALRRRLDDPKVREALIAAAGDPDLWAAGQIVAAIAGMKPPPENVVRAVTARLSAPVEDEAAAGMRVSAVLGLMRMGPAAAPAVPELLKMLDATKDGAVVVLWTIGSIGPAAKEAIPALRAKLADADPQTALAAAGALLAVAGEGLDRLTAAIADPGRARFAVMELGRAGAAAKDAAPELRKLLGNEGLRVHAAVALFGISGVEERAAYEVLLEALRTGEDRDCRMAVVALRDRPVADAVPDLVEVLRKRDASVAIHAAEALGNLGAAARPALPALQEAFATAGPPLNVAIKEAIVAVR